MSENNSTARTVIGKVMVSKKRVVGWQIRCLKCGCTELSDTQNARNKIAERAYVFSRCPNCKRIRFRVIERVPTGPF